MLEAIVVFWVYCGIVAGGLINRHLQGLAPGFSSWFFAFGWSVCCGPIALVAALVTLPDEGWSCWWD